MSSGRDGLDLDDGEFLTVAAFLFVALALFLFENDHLGTAFVFEDFGGDLGAHEKRGADLKSLAFAAGEHVGDFDDGAGFGVGEPVNGENVSLGDSELPALGLDGRFHK